MTTTGEDSAPHKQATSSSDNETQMEQVNESSAPPAQSFNQQEYI